MIDYQMNPKNMTKNLINWMSFGGCNPFKTSFWHHFLGYSYVFVSALIVTLILLNFLFTSHDSVSSLMGDSIMLFGFLQIGAKHFTCIQKSKFIADMLESIWTEFWNTEKFDEKFKKNVLIIYKRAQYLGNFYSIVVMSASSLFIVQAITKQEKTLVMEIWIPHKEILKITPYFEITYIFQAVFMLSVVWFSLVQLDRLFILLTCFIYIQQKMIQNKLDTIQNTNSHNVNSRIVQKCINQQNIVFKFLVNFDEVFSKLFLPTIATNFILTSLCMYGTIMEDSIDRKITSILIYMAVTSQLFAYCYAGHLIQEEGMNIGEAAYNSNWYEIDDRNIKMALLLMIMRSQRKIELTVGGIMILSLENFAAVVRASFTFLTFIINMRT